MWVTPTKTALMPVSPVDLIQPRPAGRAAQFRKSQSSAGHAHGTCGRALRLIRSDAAHSIRPGANERPTTSDRAALELARTDWPCFQAKNRLRQRPGAIFEVTEMHPLPPCAI